MSSPRATAIAQALLVTLLWSSSWVLIKLRTLTALESSVINNLMLIEIAILAWIFLGESLDLRELIGLAIALAGIIAVQLRRSHRSQPAVAVGLVE